MPVCPHCNEEIDDENDIADFVSSAAGEGTLSPATLDDAIGRLTPSEIRELIGLLIDNPATHALIRRR